MRIPSLRARAVGAATAAAAALAVAAPAGAATVPLWGTQTVVDENAGTFKMHGSLVGDWAITSFTVLDSSPLLHARGTERFTGCLDRARDGSCTGDPAGTLKFTIDYKALFDPPGSQNLVWGACLHPVTGGSGAFAGARGVIVMADTPTASGVSTSYIGNLTLSGKGEGRGRHARASAAGANRGCGR
jgi:hypothetical protein